MHFIRIVKDNVCLMEAPIVVYDPAGAEEFIKEMMMQIIPSLGAAGTATLLNAVAMAKGELPVHDEVAVMLTWNTKAATPPQEQAQRPGPDVRPPIPTDWSPSNN